MVGHMRLKKDSDIAETDNSYVKPPNKHILSQNSKNTHLQLLFRNKYLWKVILVEDTSNDTETPCEESLQADNTLRVCHMQTSPLQ